MKTNRTTNTHANNIQTLTPKYNTHKHKQIQTQTQLLKYKNNTTPTTQT